MTDSTHPEAAHAASEYDDEQSRRAPVPEGGAICALLLVAVCIGLSLLAAHLASQIFN